MSNLLYYHKCSDCLTAFTSTEKKIDYCDCNGDVTLMGQVHGCSYGVTVDKPACDGRCTHASGPECDCACGGANHGTGKVVQTTVILGKVKAVGLTEADIERANVYRKLRDYAQSIYDSRWGSNEYIPDRNDWRLKINAKNALDKIKKMRIYDQRTKALVEFIGTYKISG